MNYTAAKIIIVVFCSVFMVMGGSAMFHSISSGFSSFDLVWGGMFFFIPLFVMTTLLRQISKFSSMTYEWYKSAHPQNVQGNRISCFACGNAHINARALMNRTFHREHFCTQCGQTLYYSPEQS